MKITITELEYLEAYASDGGWCRACGDPAGPGIEPDARNYRCDGCGSRQVFGAEECLLMGVVEFEGES